MEKWPVKKDNRDSDSFRIYLKASNITNTQQIMNSAVSISDRYGIEVSSKTSKSSYSIDFWLILEGLGTINSLLSGVFTIIKYVHDRGAIDDGEIKTKYNSLARSEKRLVRSILQAVQKLWGSEKFVEITYRGLNMKFEADQLPRLEPLIKTLLEKYPVQDPLYYGKEYYKKVDYDQEILKLLANKENMETSYGYLTKLSKYSLSELIDSEKIELLKLLREGKR